MVTTSNIIGTISNTVATFPKFGTTSQNTWYHHDDGGSANNLSVHTTHGKELQQPSKIQQQNDNVVIK